MALWLGGIILITGSLAAFSLFKPYHIDDMMFLAAARHLVDNFPYFYGGKIGFLGRSMEWFSFNYPPLLPGYLAAWMLLIKHPTATQLHLVFLPFTILAVVSFYRVAKACEAQPRWATLLFLASPCFFLNAQSLMSDTPMTAFFLTAMAYYLEGSKKNNSSALFIAGLWSSLAWLCRYPGLLVLAVMFFHACRERRWMDFAKASAIPVALLAAWSLWTAHACGQTHLAHSLLHPPCVDFRRFWPGQITLRGVAFASFLGGSVVFPALFLGLLVSRKGCARLPLTAAVVFAAAICVHFAQGLSWERIAFFWSCLAAGLILLFAAVRRPGLPGLWLAGLFFPLVVLSPYASVRYLVIILPAACMILTSLIQGNGGRLAMVLTSFLLSLALSWSDWEVARGYLATAKAVGRKYISDSHRLYFSGEWGWRYALEESGATYLLEDTKEFRDGDILAITDQACSLLAPKDLNAAWQLLETRDIKTTLPLKLLHRNCSAGFYSHGWGSLPYGLCRGPADTVWVYRYKSPVP